MAAIPKGKITGDRNEKDHLSAFNCVLINVKNFNWYRMASIIGVLYLTFCQLKYGYRNTEGLVKIPEKYLETIILLKQIKPTKERRFIGKKSANFVFTLSIYCINKIYFNFFPFQLFPKQVGLIFQET